MSWENSLTGGKFVRDRGHFIVTPCITNIIFFSTGSPIMLGANSLPEDMENGLNNITNTTTYGPLGC